MKKCLCLCLVLLLGLSALGACAEESAFGELRYTLPEGWTETAADGVMMLAYDGGAENDNASVMMLTQDMSMLAGAGLEYAMMAEMYLGVLIESIFQTIGREFPENSSSSVSIDGQTAVRYAMQSGDNFVDSLAILRADGLCAHRRGLCDAALNGYEELVASLHFGGATEAGRGGGRPAGRADDGDALTLRRRVAEALGVEDIRVETREIRGRRGLPRRGIPVHREEHGGHRHPPHRGTRRRPMPAPMAGTRAAPFWRATLWRSPARRGSHPIRSPSLGRGAGRGQGELPFAAHLEAFHGNGYLYAYTEEAHGAASCGRLLFAVTRCRTAMWPTRRRCCAIWRLPMRTRR